MLYYRFTIPHVRTRRLGSEHALIQEFFKPLHTERLKAMLLYIRDSSKITSNYLQVYKFEKNKELELRFVPEDQEEYHKNPHPYYDTFLLVDWLEQGFYGFRNLSASQRDDVKEGSDDFPNGIDFSALHQQPTGHEILDYTSYLIEIDTESGKLCSLVTYYGKVTELTADQQVELLAPSEAWLESQQRPQELPQRRATSRDGLFPAPTAEVVEQKEALFDSPFSRP